MDVKRLKRVLEKSWLQQLKKIERKKRQKSEDESKESLLS